MPPAALLPRQDGPLLVSRQDGTAVLTLNRPAARNALNAEVLRLLRLVAAEAGADETVRAVVITGAGERAFCAGADIRGMSEMSAAGAREWAGLGHAVFRSLELLPKPVIAAVNGTAVGGGLELALACDLRVLAENAQLGQPEIKLGMIPGWGGTQRLPRLAGMTLAREMVLTGELVGAEQALRAGLANRVVPAPDVLPTALTLAARFSALPPLALGYAKQALVGGQDGSLEDALALEVDLFVRAFATADRAEGLAAFLDKRSPAFKGQ
jgi:enoyl-CoA hydratase